MATTLDFAAARRRALAAAAAQDGAHAIDIDARALTRILEHAAPPAPRPTILEALTASLGTDQVAELLHVVLEESK